MFSSPLITRSVPILARGAATLRSHQFNHGTVLLAYDGPGITLNIHLTPEEAAALRDALATPAEETV